MGHGVAHPGLVPVARTAFEAVMDGPPHQKHNLRPDVSVSDQDILNFEIKGGEITEDGLRLNLNVAILYIESWLNGRGAAAILRPDGGCGHGRNIPLSGLAMGESSGSHALGRPSHHPRHGETVYSRRVGKNFKPWSEKTHLPTDDLWMRRASQKLYPWVEFVDFLTLPAYEKLLS